MLATLVLVAAGCGNPVRKKIEAGVCESLPGTIGPARVYSVRAYGPTLRMIRGRLDGLDITGRDVKLPSGITVSRLDVRIRDIEFDTGSRQIRKAGTTEFAATLSEAELSRYLAARYPDIPQLKIDLTVGTLGISMKPGLSVVRIAVSADADLEIRDHRILALNLKKLRVAGIGVPGFVRELVNSRLDAIFDASDLGFDAKLSSARIGRGALTLAGELDLMKIVGRKD